MNHPTLRFLVRDLQRLRALATTLAGHIVAGSTGADDELDAFAEALRMRVRLEEELIFACVERFVDAPFAPTLDLRREHRMLLALLAAVEDDLALGRRGAAAGLLRHLETELAAHGRKEAEVLHPLVDRLLDRAPAPVADRVA